MAKSVVRRFEAATRVDHDGWAPFCARFHATVAAKPRRAEVSLDLHRSGVSVAIDLEAVTRREIAALERNGYAVHRWKAGARASCRVTGVEELEREIRRIKLSATDVATLESLRPRIARSIAPRGTLGRFPVALVEHVTTQMRGWRMTLFGVERRGRQFLLEDPEWTIFAWCFAIEGPPTDTSIEIGVQAYSTKKPSARATRRVEQRLAKVLGPFGYHVARIRGGGRSRPRFVVLDREVSSLAEARRERRRIDDMVFGR